MGAGSYPPIYFYITLPQFYIQSCVLGPMGLTSELPKLAPGSLKNNKTAVSPCSLEPRTTKHCMPRSTVVFIATKKCLSPLSPAENVRPCTLVSRAGPTTHTNLQCGQKLLSVLPSCGQGWEASWSLHAWWLWTRS